MTERLAFYQQRRILLGDLHNHCGISYGHGSLDDALANARLQLDFVSVTGHAAWPDIDDQPMPEAVVDYHLEGFRKLAAGWGDYLEQIDAANEPGRFTTFFGHEVHSFRHGDRTIVTVDPPSAPAVGISYDAFRELLAGADARTERRLLLPHHIGYPTGLRGIDWESVTDAASPIVEILSMHGLAEADGQWWPYLHTMGPLDTRNTMSGGLAAGHHFGVVASTDHHSAHPGSFGHGRTAVWATDCTREAIWEAICDRRTYALSGDRIELAFAINGQPLGSRIDAEGDREVSIDVKAGGAIDRVELVRNGEVVARFAPERGGAASSASVMQPETIGGLVVLEFGWGEKGVAFDWDVTVTLEGGEILDVEPRLRGHDIVDPLDRSDAQCRFSAWERLASGFHLRTRTAGNPTTTTSQTQAMALTVRAARDARLTIEGAGPSRTVALSDLLVRPVVHHTAGFVSPAVCIHRFISDIERSGSWTFTDPAPTVARAKAHGPEQEDWYYVRVVQTNGHGAWSSPIWVSRPGERRSSAVTA